VIFSIVAMFLPENERLKKLIPPLVSLTVLLGWLRIFQLLGVLKESGVFIAIFSKMLGDVLRFLMIYSIFWVAFSSCFQILMPDLDGFNNFISALGTMYRTMLGDSGYSDVAAHEHYSSVGASLYLLYLLIACVVLVNLLVAMMATSYETVQNDAEAEAFMERTDTILRIEETLNPIKRKDAFDKLFPKGVGTIPVKETRGTIHHEDEDPVLQKMDDLEKMIEDKMNQFNESRNQQIEKKVQEMTELNNKEILSNIDQLLAKLTPKKVGSRISKTYSSPSKRSSRIEFTS